MLSSLNIVNLGIIESLFIEFESNFCSITGETGSGKSLIIKALSLIKGVQAGEHFIGPFKENCTIQASFKLSKDQDIEYFNSNELIITRKLFKSKSSQCFINDELVTLKKLKQVCNRLFFLSSQDEVYFLSQAFFQLQLYDEFCGLPKLETYQTYRNTFKTFEKLTLLEKESKPLTLLHQKLSQLNDNIEELLAAELEENEENNLKNEQKLLQNRKQTLIQIGENSNKLYELDSHLHTCINTLQKLDLKTDVPAFIKQADAFKLNLSDLQSSLKDEQNQLELLDEEREYFIENRLNELFKLAFKYNLKPGDCLVKTLETLAVEKKGIELEINTQTELQHKKEAAYDLCKTLAKQLHKERAKSLKTFSDKMCSLGKELGLENMRFEIQQIQLENLHEYGSCGIKFLFSANPDSPLESIEKCSSGGEKSRLLLALYSILGKQSKSEVMIFDEIDTGISGLTAKKVGLFLAKMSKSNPILCVTHLEQVAAMAEQHIMIKKQIQNGRTSVQAFQNINSEELISNLRG